MRTRWLSLDPYMCGRMSAAKSYAKPVEVGATMVGGTVGEVVASRNPNFAIGDIRDGLWLAGLCSCERFRPTQTRPRGGIVSPALGVVGMPGMTEYVWACWRSADRRQARPLRSGIKRRLAACRSRAGLQTASRTVPRDDR
jgi:NADPH-dependent curcumin reductase CurA